MAYWLPFPARDDFPENIHLKATVKVGESIREPVLVDMMDGSVRETTSFIREGKGCIFEMLPLRDYLCLVAEREALPIDE